MHALKIQHTTSPPSPQLHTALSFPCHPLIFPIPSTLPHHRQLPTPLTSSSNLIKSLPNTLPEPPLAKLPLGFIAQPARNLVEFVVGNDGVLLQAILSVHTRNTRQPSFIFIHCTAQPSPTHSHLQNKGGT